MTTKIYAILDSETNEFAVFNSRNSWSSLAAVQSSFHASQKYYRTEDRVRWKEQTRYYAVELTEYYFMYGQLEK